MTVIFKNLDEEAFRLKVNNETRTLKDVEIKEGKEITAWMFFPKIRENPSYSDLEKLIKFYANDKSDTKLKAYLQAIKDKDIEFRTQNKRSLRIEVI